MKVLISENIHNFFIASRLKEATDYNNDAGDSFWGNLGAGVLPICKETGRLLIAHRSAEVNEPHTWGIWGGKLDSHESNLRQVASREFKEETQYHGPINLIPSFVFRTANNSFEYHNFIGLVEGEFDPKLDWENDGFRWVTFDELVKLDNKHFGLEALLKNEPSIEKYCKKGINENSDDVEYFANKKAFDEMRERKRDPQTVEDWIADYFNHGGKISPASFKRNLDKNYFIEKLNYISKNGAHIDDLAMSLSNACRMDINDQNIINFIETYKSPSNYYESIRLKIKSDMIDYYGNQMVSELQIKLKPLVDRGSVSDVNIGNKYVLKSKRYGDYNEKEIQIFQIMEDNPQLFAKTKTIKKIIAGKLKTLVLQKKLNNQLVKNDGKFLNDLYNTCRQFKSPFNMFLYADAIIYFLSLLVKTKEEQKEFFVDIMKCMFKNANPKQKSLLIKYVNFFIKVKKFYKKLPVLQQFKYPDLHENNIGYDEYGNLKIFDMFFIRDNNS